MDYGEAVALIEQRRDAWLREDVETYLSLFADDFRFEADGVEQSRGREALEDTIRRNYARFRPISWDVHEIAVHGQNALGEWTVVIEERKTGIRSSLKAMFICEIQDGLTKWVREYRLPGWQ
jgi:limonene-1,2-epoxide hydrolase